MIKPVDLLTKQIENFGKKSPRLIDTLGFISETGSHLNLQMAHVITTLNYIQKCKATSKDKVRAYESILQELANVCTDLSTLGMFSSSMLMSTVTHLDEALEMYKRSDADSFQRFVCERRARYQRGGKNENND